MTAQPSAKLPTREHEYKVWPAYFDAIVDGSKPFDVRKEDHRRETLEIGDTVRFREWNQRGAIGGEYTGREVTKRVTYVLDGGSLLPEGWLVMGLAALETPAPAPSDAVEMAREDDAASCQAFAPSESGEVTSEEAERRVRVLGIGLAANDQARLLAYIQQSRQRITVLERERDEALHRQFGREYVHHASRGSVGEELINQNVIMRRERDTATERAAAAEGLLREIIATRSGRREPWEFSAALDAGTEYLATLKPPTDAGTGGACETSEGKAG